MRPCNYTVARHGPRRPRQKSRDVQTENENAVTDTVAIPTDNAPSPGISMESNLHGTVQGRVSTSPNDTLMTTVVSNGNDALNLLFEAAQREEDSNQSPHAPAADGSSFHTIVAPIPCILETNQNSLPELSSEVLDTWNAYRFVRMGWLSASETVWLLDMSVRPCFGQ
jgi:hypothetical protein